MAWTTPHNWEPNELVTAALLNTHLKDNLNFLYNAPGARIYNSANLSVSSGGSGLLLTFDSERYDTDSIHDPGQSARLTCKTAGKYLISGHVLFAANATGYRGLIIRLNGSATLAIMRTPALGASDYPILSIATVYNLNVNDYVELIAEQNSGTALTLYAWTHYSLEFAMHWLGA
jgi:hypothetical protein